MRNGTVLTVIKNAFLNSITQELGSALVHHSNDLNKTKKSLITQTLYSFMNERLSKLGPTIMLYKEYSVQ